MAQSTNYCWSYDSFGNRTAQVASNQSISGGGSAACQTQSGASVTSSLASYATGANANTNRLTGTAQAPGGPAYDAAGDVTNDGVNQYLYNGDGQICAVRMTVNGTTIMTGYL